MGLEIIQVDAFTDRPFGGNPAAVCVLPEMPGESWMQNVAREMNLSETAFLCRERDGFRLRWFTPTVEVDLCGHATLASAHVLWETGRLGPDQQARFYTRSGLLTAERKAGLIELDFPAEPPEAIEAPSGLVEALRVEPKYVGKNRRNYLVEVESEETVRGMEPDFTRLSQFPAVGFIVTSRASSEGYDFVSRFFAPSAGINEDPVTGSAHCCLGPFWQSRLNRDEFVAYQASARGGTLHVRVAGDRVRIGGEAVTVMRGELAADS